MLAKNEIFNIATQAIVSDKNMKRKQSEKHVFTKQRRKSHQSYFKPTKV